MANPLIAEYQAFANMLNPVVQQLVANNRPIAAQQVGAAQGTLRAACVTLIANDINNLLDPTDPQMAQAIAQIAAATNALRIGAAVITQDINSVTKIVSIASDAVQIASSLVPLNVSEIISAATDTVSVLT